MSEAKVTTDSLLAIVKLGWHAWRNNRGAFKDATGRWVRYGLLNESKRIGDAIKSADYIGIRPVLVTEDMVGQVIGQFLSLEFKSEGWKFNPNDPHDVAQYEWYKLVKRLGGAAAFISDPVQLHSFDGMADTAGGTP